MMKSLSLTLIVAGLTVTNFPAQAAVNMSKKTSDETQSIVDGGMLRVQFWSPEIVRVTYAATNELPALKSLRSHLLRNSLQLHLFDAREQRVRFDAK